MSEKGQGFPGLCTSCNFHLRAITAEVMTDGGVINGGGREVYHWIRRTGSNLAQDVNERREKSSSDLCKIDKLCFKTFFVVHMFACVYVSRRHSKEYHVYVAAPQEMKTQQR